jgi:hypothetical protein
VNGYGQAFMGVDHATYYNGTNARGRPSLRLESVKIYNGGLFIADIAHMPGNSGDPSNSWMKLIYD